LQKLREKFAKDPEKYKTLQGIVESEIEEKTTTAKNSATDALLWLKRLVACKMNAKTLLTLLSSCSSLFSMLDLRI